jgi:EmrB/QacA subfamily drug resistance transporter
MRSLIRRWSRATAAAPRWWIMVVTSLGLLLVVGSIATLNIALPDIARGTGASQNQMTWIVDAYTLVMAGLLLPAGTLADRFGRRGAFVLGLAIFGLASLPPIWWDGATLLIICRAVTGLGAAFLMPATLAIVTSEFPPEQRPRAIALWAGLAGAGGTLGLGAAGLLLRSYSYRSIFVFTGALAAVAICCAVTIPTSRDPSHARLDVPGAVTSALAMGSLVYAVIQGPTAGWLSATVLAPAAAALVLGVAFVRVELRTRSPLLDVRLFAMRPLGSGSAVILCQFVVTFGYIFLVIQYLQFLRGYSPLSAGLALFPMAITMMAVAPLGPFLAARLGLRVTSVAGMALLGVSMLLTGWAAEDGSYLRLAAGMIVLGLSIGISTSPATTAIVDSVGESKRGVASALNDSVRELGSALGIAVAGSVLAAGYSSGLASLARLMPPKIAHLATSSIAAALEIAERGGPRAAPLATAARRAYLHGMHSGLVVLALICFAAAAVLVFWAPGRPQRSVPAVSATTYPEELGGTGREAVRGVRSNSVPSDNSVSSEGSVSSDVASAGAPPSAAAYAPAKPPQMRLVRYSARALRLIDWRSSHQSPAECTIPTIP